MSSLFKKILILFSILVTCVLVAASSYYAADFKSVSDAEKKWGLKTLNTSQFKSGDLDLRAPMAVDIIKRNLYVGKTRKTIREELGDPDSYFFSDTIYAYKIMPFPGEKKENWHLVFIPDEKLEKIKEVKIHKKCCYLFPL